MDERIVPLVLLALAVVWTWPALLGHHVLGHHPDAPGTAWFLSAAPRLVNGLSDPLSGWPAGAHYGRPDSFVLMLVGTVGAPLGAVRLLGLVTVLGVALSAWAMESVARQLGAKRPWSMVAGLGFAFSGLASTALLEGYPYHLVNPFLPLFLGAWLRATGTGGRPRDGALAGLGFVCCLATTAWMGLACVPIGLVILVAARPRWDQARLRTIAMAVLVAGPLVGFYLWLFRAGGTVGADALADAGFPTPSLGQTLLRFGVPGPSIDLHGYTQSATLPAAVLALCVVSHRLVPDTFPRRPLIGAGLFALFLALLPALLGVWTADLAGLDDPMVSVLASSLMRFPDRLSWGALACFGLVAAMALTGLAERHPRAAAVVFGLALMDAFVVPRMPVRQRRMTAEVPGAYAAHRGPVLDIWPKDPSPAPAWNLWTTNLGCYYQVVHQRPIADLCIVSPGVLSPRIVLQEWLLDQWLSGDVESTLSVLRDLGFGSVAVHSAVMSPSDRARLVGILEQWPDPVHSTDGGDEVWAAAIPGAQPVSAADARAAWQRWLAEQHALADR